MTPESRLFASGTAHARNAAGSEKALDFTVPDDLKELDQWVVWRNETRNGKPTKVPFRTSIDLPQLGIQ